MLFGSFSVKSADEKIQLQLCQLDLSGIKRMLYGKAKTEIVSICI